MIPDVLYRILIDFVEGEECFETTVWDSDAKSVAAKKKIIEIYAWAKHGRAAKEAELNLSYPENSDGEYDVVYAEVNRIEKEIENKDTEYLRWVTDNRGLLWT